MVPSECNCQRLTDCSFGMTCDGCTCIPGEYLYLPHSLFHEHIHTHSSTFSFCIPHLSTMTSHRMFSTILMTTSIEPRPYRRMLLLLLLDAWSSSLNLQVIELAETACCPWLLPGVLRDTFMLIF